MSMRDGLDVVLGIVFTGVCLGVWVFPSYSYAVMDGVLVARRKIFRWIPFGTRRLSIESIQKAEPSGLGRVPVGALLWGSPFALQGVLLTLSIRRLVVWRKIYVTPPDPGGFISELEGLLPCQARAVDAVSRRVRLPHALWVTDVAVAISAACFGAAIVILRVDDLREAVFGSLHGKVFALAAGALMLATVLWLWMHCMRNLVKSRDLRLAFWVILIILAYPVAWVYYLAEWRPRRRAGEA